MCFYIKTWRCLHNGLLHIVGLTIMCMQWLLDFKKSNKVNYSKEIELLLFITWRNFLVRICLFNSFLHNFFLISNKIKKNLPKILLKLFTVENLLDSNHIWIQTYVQLQQKKYLCSNLYSNLNTYIFALSSPISYTNTLMFCELRFGKFGEVTFFLLEMLLFKCFSIN